MRFYGIILLVESLSAVFSIEEIKSNLPSIFLNFLYEKIIKKSN